MESQHPTHHPFSRPHAHMNIPNIPNAQFPPIPPPPYSSSTSAPHTELLHRNDPFLRRRTERDHQQASSPTPGQPRTYMAATTSQYQANALAGPQTSARDAPNQSGRDGQDMSYGSGDSARHQAQLKPGTCDGQASSMVSCLISMKGNIHVALMLHLLAFSLYPYLFSLSCRIAFTRYAPCGEVIIGRFRRMATLFYLCRGPVSATGLVER